MRPDQEREIEQIEKDLRAEEKEGRLMRALALYFYGLGVRVTIGEIDE